MLKTLVFFMIKSLPNLYSRIRLPKEAVRAMTSNISNLYEKRSQPKRKFGEDQLDESGEIRYRKLNAPRFKLKIVQKRINDLLQEFTLPDNMFGSVIGKNNILHAAQHLNHTYFLTIDLKDFFHNIDSRTVF